MTDPLLQLIGSIDFALPTSAIGPHRKARIRLYEIVYFLFSLVCPLPQFYYSNQPISRVRRNHEIVRKSSYPAAAQLNQQNDIQRNKTYLQYNPARHTTDETVPCIYALTLITNRLSTQCINFDDCTTKWFVISVCQKQASRLCVANHVAVSASLLQSA